MLKVLDGLEEWLIATLVAGATMLIFVAVAHRCICMFVWMAKFGGAPSAPWAPSSSVHGFTF